MPDMLSWGANWLSDITALHAVQQVTITDTATGALPSSINAILADEAGRLLPGTVNVRTEHTVFLFESSDIAASGITFKAGTSIVLGENAYEVVKDSGKFWTYNDVFKRKIKVSAKHVTS
jgi:hypothetical protein